MATDHKRIQKESAPGKSASTKKSSVVPKHSDKRISVRGKGLTKDEPVPQMPEQRMRARKDSGKETKRAKSPIRIVINENLARYQKSPVIQRKAERAAELLAKFPLPQAGL